MRESLGVTPRQLEAYQLRIVENRTTKEVAEIMDIANSTVHRLLKKAKASMALQPKIDAVKLTAGRIAVAEEDRFQRNTAMIDELDGKMNAGKLIGLMENRRVAALAMLDDELLAKSTSQQLIQVINGLTDRIQLLKGEPTQITKIEDVRKMDEIASLLLKEVEKRGITFDNETGELV